MKMSALVFFYFAFLIPNAGYSQVDIINQNPVDKFASKQTNNLLFNLRKYLQKGIMFGHQESLAYGVGWKYEYEKSDIKTVTGEFPAVYGFDLGRIEQGSPVNIDSVPFDSMRNYIKRIYKRGGIVTLSWHLNNPLTGKSAWNPAPGTFEAILPGGEKNDVYKSWLDKVAAYILSLKSDNGEPIPVILRLFHEWNGNWFWWGKDHCTPAQFKDLWQFTISYLRDEKHVHQLLYAFNTDRFHSKEEYLQKYPGDGFVNLVGMDIYQQRNGAYANQQFVNDLDTMLTMLCDIANVHKKIPALTEFGYNTIPDSTWWTNVFYRAIKNHKISFALAWRNAGYKRSGEAEYYVPFEGQASEKDFKKFAKEPRILFQNDLSYKKVYE